MVLSERDRASAPATPRARGRRSQKVRARRSLTTVFARSDPRWRDLAIVVVLFASALALRWPYLLRLPHFTDETVELEWSLAIWRGEIFPLTASDRYYGPGHSYLVAGAFWLFGPSIILPRAIVMVFGAATVALTYLLGRALAGRLAGILGAGLLATAPQHIIVNSHVACQNSTTPLYATLTFLALSLALNRLRDAARDGDRPLLSRRRGGLWRQLGRMISNPMRIPAEDWHYLTSPHLVLMAILCLAGIVLLALRQQPLPLCALLCTVAIMPAFNKAYGQTWDRYMLTGRYVTFLLPLAFIAAGVTIVALVDWLWRAWSARRIGRWPGRALLAVAVVAMSVLVAYPLQPLFRYYTHEAAKDPANASILATVAFIDAARGARTPVIIGRKFSSVDLKDGADVRETFDLLFDLNGTPHVSPHNTHAEIERIVRAAPPGDREALPLIIMMRDECWQMRDRRPYQRISERYRMRELYWQLPSYYAVYRYVPHGEPGGCAPATGPEPGE